MHFPGIVGNSPQLIPEYSPGFTGEVPVNIGP